MLRGTHLNAVIEHPARRTLMLQKEVLMGRKQVLLAESEQLSLHEVVWGALIAAHSLGLTVLVSGVGLGSVYKEHHKVMGFT